MSKYTDYMAKFDAVKVKNDIVVTYFVMLVKEDPSVLGKDCC